MENLSGEILTFFKSNLFTNIIIAFFTGLYAWTYYKDHKSTIPTITKIVYDHNYFLDCTVVNNANHNIAIKDVYVLKKKYLYIECIKKTKTGSKSRLRYVRYGGWMKISGKWYICNLAGEKSPFTSISNEHLIRLEPEKKYKFQFRYIPANAMKVIIKTSGGKGFNYSTMRFRIDRNQMWIIDDTDRIMKKLNLPFKNRSYTIYKSSEKGG